MRGQSKSESTIGARSEQDPVSKPLHLPTLQVWYEERTPSNWTLPSPAKRCDYVVTEVRKRNKNYSRALLQATAPALARTPDVCPPSEGWVARARV